MRVDFVICGTQKGGTSALDAYLRRHPQLCMAGRKEVHFFDDEDTFRDNRPDCASYHAAFSPEPSHKLVGESTPIYMYWYEAPRRMWQYNPNMKLIVVLRNPIARAYSHWNMERSRNADSLSFWEALRCEPERCRAALPYQHRVYSYVDRGFYLEQLRRLWKYFTKEQVLLLKTEELRLRPVETLQRVCEFLSVGPLQRIEPTNVHCLPYTRSMNDHEKEYLRYVFEYEIRAIERELAWDCSQWLSE